MKRIFVIILFLVPFLAKAQEVDQPAEKPARYTLEDKVYALSLIWSEIKYNFANIDLLEFDLDSLYRETMVRAIDTTDDLEYFAELDRFMASMQDGHTQIISRTYNWNDHFDYIPANIMVVNKRFYFSRIRQGTAYEHLLDAEIIEIEGMPVSEYVENFLLPWVVGSTDQIRYYEASVKMVGGVKGSFFKGVALSVTGERLPFEIERNGETTRTPEDKYIGWESLIVRRNKIVTTEWIDDIAYIDIRSFARDEIRPLLDTLMPSINRKAKAVIIDLRYNGGGSTLNGEHLAKYIVPSDTIYRFGAMVRTNHGYRRAQGVFNTEYEYADVYRNRSFDTIKSKTILREDHIKPLDCPVVILIGKMTYSAAEDMLLGIYDIPGRPLFFGEETGGSSGAPLVVHLPHDAAARICTIKMLYPVTHKPFVGHGIVPDVEIKPQIEDYKAGRDVVKEKALEYLTDVLNKP